MPVSKSPSARPVSKNPSSRVRSASASGRRNARRAAPPRISAGHRGPRLAPARGPRGAVGRGQRPAERPPRDPAQNLGGAPWLVFRARRAAREETGAARHIAHAGGVVGPVDAEVAEVRQPGQPGKVPGRQIRQRLLERHHEILDRTGRTLDERGRDLVRPGRDRNRRCPQDVGRPQLAVEVDERHPLAVDGDLDLLPGGRDVVAEERSDAREVERQAEDVVAVGRELMPHGDPTARAERRPRHVAHLGERLRHDVGRDRRGRLGVADRESRDAARRGQIAVDQRRRHGEDVRHVVVALAHVVRRQERRDVDRHPGQLAHRVGVLRAVETVEDRAARARRSLGRAVDAPLDVGDERGELRGGRARAALGRHHSRPQLQDDPLEGRRVGDRIGGVERFQRQPGAAGPVVVATDAVPLQQGVPVDRFRWRSSAHRGRDARHDDGQHACEQRAANRQNRGSDRHRRDPLIRGSAGVGAALVRRTLGPGSAQRGL